MDPTAALIVIFFLSFICEYVDSTLGMGFGTTLTPALLIMGYSPLAVVPAILLAELFTGSFAAYMHHRAGNVKFDFRNDPEHRIVKKMMNLGYIPRSHDSKIAFVLGVCSFLGAVAAAVIAFQLPVFFLKLFIGIVVLSMGVLILLKRNVKHRFSWRKIIGLGVAAAFNKGLSGGGYGPLVTSGQILSGVNARKSVAITSLAESFTCLVAVLTYLILGTGVDWTMAPVLVAGGLISVPFSTRTVRKVRIANFTLTVGVATVILGLFTLYKILF